MRQVWLIVLAALPWQARGQAIRIDPDPVMVAQSTLTSFSSANVVAAPFATVALCAFPANGVPCTNYATTYTDATMQTACPGQAQVVLPYSSTCSTSTDALGNFGFWVAPGMYSYTIQSSKGYAGPFFLSTNTSSTKMAGDFGIVCDGKTDATQGFVSLNAYLRANDDTTVIFPSNSTCLTSLRDWLWHVINVRLIGNNTAVIWTGETNASNYTFVAGGNDFVCEDFQGTTQTVNYYTYLAAPIQAAGAGSKSVPVKNSSDISSWQAGDEVLIYGYDEQAGGFPPNYRYFDRTTIQSVDPKKGIVTVADALNFTYNPNWPYWANANTTPPAIKNFTRSCTNGGGIYPMQHLYVQGFDFSQPAPNAPSAHTAAWVGDVKLAEFNQCKFLNFTPTTTQTLKMNECTFGDMEIDKLIGTVTIQNSKFIGDSFTTHVLSEGVGANMVELDNDEFWGQTVLAAKTTHYRNCTWHYLNEYGFTGDALGFWGGTLIVDSPVFAADGGPTPGSLIYKNPSSTATVLSVAGSSSFTVSLSDGADMASRCGPGSLILASTAPYQKLGTVSDIAFNSGATAMVIAGNFSGLKPHQVIQYSPNPTNVQVTNPAMTGSDINQWSPVFVGEYAAYFPNLQFDFPQATTVANLGPCNLPSNGTTKTVTDAANNQGGAVVQGGGTLTLGVVCQGIDIQGHWVIR